MSYSIRQTKNKTLVQGYNVEIFGEGLELDMEGQACWFVYTDGGDIAGFATGKCVGDDTFYLSRAGLLPRHRGKGLQKRLIKVRLRYAKANNFDTVITYTMLDNPESYASLQNCGFKLYMPEYRWAGNDVLYWIKRVGNETSVKK